MKKFGEYLGIAYQIKDDLFDYQKSSKIGKPTGNDIKNKKLTLPLIYALENCDKKSRRKMIRLINHSSKSGRDEVKKILHFVEQYNGISYAESVIEEYKNQALEILEPFPDNEIRQALQNLVHYVAARKK